MIRAKEVPLKIELFSSGEDSPFLIRSKTEIRFVLQGIAQKGARAALYYDEGKDFILTTLLGADGQGIWLDVGPHAADNRRILRSKELIFVSSHQQVKVQFAAHHAESVLFENRETFYLPLPDTLLRLQRRDYYRLLAPVREPLKCVVPAIPSAQMKPNTYAPKREITIMDISAGGVALVCAEHETELQPGKIYPDCRISLPDTGILVAAIRVKNIIEITSRDGAVHKHAGCEFIHLDGKMAILLQRYIIGLQNKTPVRL